MNQNKIAISILTHNAPDRALALYRTILSLINNTVIPIDTPIKIFLNSYNLDILYIIEYLKNTVSLNIEVEKSEVNLGCATGINRLNKMTKDYEYVLFIEGDWYTFPERLTGVNNNWLNNSISFLDLNPYIDTIHLRKFIHMLDVRMHGGQFVWGMSNLTITDFNNIKYRFINNANYTNNPQIRRNKRFYDIGIFPLPEYNNETKGNDNWGKAEIDRMALGAEKLTTYYLNLGIMGHHEYIERVIPNYQANELISDLDISSFTNYCKFNSLCKYGFITNNINKEFCDVCNTSIINEPLQNHDDRFIKLKYK